MTMTGDTGGLRRLRVVIRGVVQGVGFRPFVYRLAREAGLGGWVVNSAQGVFLEVEGMAGALDDFLTRLRTQAPPRASIQSLEWSLLEPAGLGPFEIRESDECGPRTAVVMPDVAVCADCLREMFDPADRRYLYPFINCTNCGPRYSIIEALPYDRPNTTMRRFAMCADCATEYNNPLDRRFHAQPIACPACGPRLALWRGVVAGEVAASGHEALRAAAAALRRGEIVAVKGLGGFHLMADAAQGGAVRRLRERKRREAKPLALMVPDMGWARRLCVVSASEERLLASPESPIVLMARRTDAPVAAEVAPDNPSLGVMLPYTPLHHLLLREAGLPLVATSGNLSDEPICTDEREAAVRLGAIADWLLVHDRPIARAVDDSVVRVLCGREQVLRRARGYAPLPVMLPGLVAEGETIFAAGAHLKNTVALTAAGGVVLSQHIGDLDTAESHEAFVRTAASLQGLYGASPSVAACDLHPDYHSTHYARSLGLPVRAVQHHHAHLLACLAENDLRGPALGVVWDGTGYGLDGTIWGGEFLIAELSSPQFRRAGHLRPFRLPGGDAAAREPRRAALAVLFDTLGPEVFSLQHLPTLGAFTPEELRVLRAMLESGVHCPVTTSAGRLFDAVASLAGLRQRSTFEGQAAMELEFAAGGMETCRDFVKENNENLNGPHYEYSFTTTHGNFVIDWRPAVRAILADIHEGYPARFISVGFHSMLTRCIVSAARHAGVEHVVLTGGCFQNRLLTEGAVAALSAAGFVPVWHQRVPPNDGGVALGQVVAALAWRGGGGKG
ncbi:MAG: carbamoyltransferase HypF [Candidatus Sumerlaeaceae bacterium]|nr:carbamoyltransferase HypF [Candidatus Sumerlaeaceae bacterium]